MLFSVLGANQCGYSKALFGKGRREDKKKIYISDMTFFFVWLAIEEGKPEKTERIASIQAHISHPPQLG